MMAGSAMLRNNRIVANGQAAIRALSSDNTALTAMDNDLRGNKAGAWDCGSAAHLKRSARQAMLSMWMMTLRRLSVRVSQEQ